MKMKSMARHLAAAMMTALLALQAGGVVAAEAGSGSAQVLQRVDVNKASAEALQAVNGIGPAKAQAIVSHREKFGSFKSGKDLLAVEGIGEKTLQRIRPQLSF